jgi:hypothetical protein
VSHPSLLLVTIGLTRSRVFTRFKAFREFNNMLCNQGIRPSVSVRQLMSIRSHRCDECVGVYSSHSSVFFLDAIESRRSTI